MPHRPPLTNSVLTLAVVLLAPGGCARDSAGAVARDSGVAPSAADAEQAGPKDAAAAMPPLMLDAGPSGQSDAHAPGVLSSDGAVAEAPDAARDAGSDPQPVVEGGTDAGHDPEPVADASVDPWSDSGTDAGFITDGGGDAATTAGSTPEVDAEIDDAFDGDMGPPKPAPRACAIQVSVASGHADPAFLAEPYQLTSWTTHQGNAAHDGWVPISLDSTRFEPRWTFEDYGRELSAVTVDHGVVVLSSGGEQAAYRPTNIVHALSVQSGRTLWTHNAVMDDRVGPPAIADGVVFAQVGAQSWAKVVAFDVGNGSVLWSAPYGAQWPEFLAPTVDGDSVFVGGGTYGGMYAFDRQTGAERWYADSGEGSDGFTPTPRAHDVLAMVGKSLYVVDRLTGESVQAIKHPAVDWYISPMNSVVVQTSPTTFVGALDKQLFAFDLEAGNVAWNIADSFSGQPVVANGELYVRNGSALEARDPIAGDLRWKWTPTQGAIGPQIVVTDNLALVTTEGMTHAIDLSTHLPVWSYPEAGQLAIGQGTLFIAGTTRLTAIDVLGDSDHDELPDWWELHQAGGDMDPSQDPDGDALDNAQELIRDTHPGCADSDGDGLLDGPEVDLGVGPTNPDSDGDSLSDGDEVLLHRSDATVVDTDADGIGDDLEVQQGFDPTNPQDALADDDADGYLNAYEIRARTDARDPSSIPRPKSWAMHQGDARHDGYQPLWLDATRFASNWATSLDEDIVGVALGERHVAVTTRFSTSVFDADDGTLRWRSRAPTIGDFSNVWTQNSAPGLAGGHVFVHSAEHLSGTLWVRDARTGTLRYRRYHGSQLEQFLAPTLFGGRVHMNGGYYGGLVTLDARTGDTLWTLPKPQADGNWEPAVTEDGLWLVQDDAMGTFDPRSGAVRTVAEPRLPYRSPVLDRDGNAYFAAVNGYHSDEVLTSVHRASGRMRWKAEHGPISTYGEPAAGNYRVYAIRNGVLEEYHPFHGRKLWSWHPEGEALTSNLVLTASHAFVASADATYAVDLRSLEVSYRYPFGGQLALDGEAKLAIFSGARLDVIDLEGDVDGDGIADWWERAQGHDVGASEDLDGDGLDALGEYLAETDPTRQDTEGDGLGDAEEVAMGTLPLIADSDGDTLADGKEVRGLGSNPLSPDSDADGIPDALEVRAGLDPNNTLDAAQDLDHDGFDDRHEALAGSDPFKAQSVPHLHDWAMFRGDADHAASQPLVLDPKHFATAWTVDFPTDGSFYAITSPAVDEEHVYVCVDGELRAFSVSDGAHVWSTAVAGDASSPTVGDGLVYVHTGGNAALWGFDRLDGKQVFRTAHTAQWPRYYAPTLSDGVVVAPAGTYGGMIAIDAYVGSELWQHTDAPSDGWEPTVRDGRAFLFARSLRAYDLRTGSEQYAVTPGAPITGAGYRSTTTLALAQSGLLIAGGFTSLVAFDSADGAERWRATPDGRDFGLPAVAAGRVYAIRNGLLEALDESSGRRLWTWQPDEFLPADSILATATHLFVGGAKATYAIDLATQQEVWRYEVGGDLSLSAQGLLVIQNSRSLTAVRLSP